MYTPTSDTAGRQWHPAPITNPQTSGAMTGVYLSDDEEVDWNMSYINGHAVCHGYTITKKPRSFDTCDKWPLRTTKPIPIDILNPMPGIVKP